MIKRRLVSLEQSRVNYYLCYKSLSKLCCILDAEKSMPVCIRRCKEKNVKHKNYVLNKYYAKMKTNVLLNKLVNL